MRWGPVVASVVVAVALIAAGLTGISAFVGDASTEYGLVRLDGMVGESMVVLALALLASCVAFALRRAPLGAVVALGVVTAVSASISRASLASDADLVREFIDATGSATGVDSRLVDAAGGAVTRVEVGTAMGLLALGAAASLVVVGWASWVELTTRRRGRPVGSPVHASGESGASGESEASDAAGGSGDVVDPDH